MAVAMELKPIYFDYRSSEIRPDAAVELDRVASVLQQDPESGLAWFNLGLTLDATGDWVDAEDAYVQALTAVTPEEVAQAAERYLTTERRFVVTLAPEGAAASAGDDVAEGDGPAGEAEQAGETGSAAGDEGGEQ